MKILVTGCTGFIGMHTSKRLLDRGDEVVGIDNLNNYYDVELKKARLNQLLQHPNFRFHEVDIANREQLAEVFMQNHPDKVIHLAAQAGVRYSLINPQAFVDSNLTGFANVLEGSRLSKVSHLVYASSSSVYGSSKKIPFKESDNVDHPVSLYAATKKANELLAHSYSHLYKLTTTGLRYFTVYGPWGRPDMAPWLFTKAILEGKGIQVFNHGKMLRDFTYIDDIVDGTVAVLDGPFIPQKTSNQSQADVNSADVPYSIYNIGNNKPVELLIFIKLLEDAVGVKARLNLTDMQPGDVVATYADIDRIQQDYGFRPKTPLADGLPMWVDWYKKLHKQ